MDRVELAGDPATLLAEIRSSTGGRVIKHLGFGEATAANARLVEAQLDADSDQEVILEMDLSIWVAVCVLDRAGTAWYSLGCLVTSLVFGESFELRKVTSAKTHDVIVRSRGTGCGGGYCASSYGILHVTDGKLYEVFQVEDSVSTICFEKDTRISMPEPGLILLLSESRAASGAAPICAPVRREARCSALRWDAGSLAFVNDKAVTEKRCRK